MRRRRECAGCGERFTTFERVVGRRLYVRKRDGRRQPFDAEKLRGALVRAAHKRDVSAAEIHGIVAAVEGEATAAGGRDRRPPRIGEICLERLRELDRGAYLQFAGTLPDFEPGNWGVGDRGGFRPGGARAWIVHLQSQYEERFR